MPAPIHTTGDWRGRFDTIIDARSPAEYADDHIPGAVNLPVLDDDERARVGTIYKKESAFAARKLGARLAAQNIARHIENSLGHRRAKWKPLVYCWRGGQRSGAFARILAEIGWVTTVLDGGYKHYRREMQSRLATRAGKLRPVLLQGKTGTAKTKFLRGVPAHGGQVLDLEALARHRGSMLGAEPESPQPSQRYFESLLHDALAALDPDRPVLIEAESSRIGACHIPRPLWQKMRAAPQIVIEAGIEQRVRFLKREYAHILENPAPLHDLIDAMKKRHGNAICNGWRKLLGAGDWDGLVLALMREHYDPAYDRAGRRGRPEILARLEVSGQGAIRGRAREIAEILHEL